MRGHLPSTGGLPRVQRGAGREGIVEEPPEEEGGVLLHVHQEGDDTQPDPVLDPLGEGGGGFIPGGHWKTNKLNT